MPLNEAQQRAVNYLEGPLLVLAGPGTGKTQLLSAKVAHILETTDANPENILCLTFTDAGASNMRDRLQTMIGKSSAKVHIYTYHAFGKTILDRYQNYAEVPERQLETAVDETSQYQIITRIQKSLPATDILRTASTADIISTISNAKSARLTPKDLAKIAEQNLRDGEEITAAISPILESAQKGARVKVALPETYEPILEELVRLISDQPIVGSIERIANTMARELSTIISDLKAEDKPSMKPLTAWRDKYYERNSLGMYRLKDHVANKKLLSLAGIMEAYETYLNEHKLYDFDDMIECAIHYLKDDRGFRLSLSEQFQYVLLDEFQDTNTSQFELIKLLTDYEKPVVMAVGDDDQAIYAFQGANASNLMDFREHYQAEVISLTVNYRSTGEILKLSRHIADQINDSFAKTYSEVQKVLTSFKDEQSAAPSLRPTRHEFPAASAEYFWVAKEIRRLLDAGEDPNEIAVLAPKHQYLCEILPYLKHEHIDVTYEKQENLYDDEKFSALFKIAEFTHSLSEQHNPASLLPEILSYDFWELPMSDVIGLFGDRHQKKPALDYLAPYPEIANFFAELVKKSFTAPLELWISYLIGTEPLGDYRSPYLQYHENQLSESELLEFYEGLATVRQTVLAHSESIGLARGDTPKLRDLIATLHDYEEAGTPINRTSIYRDSDRAVQVMTAFKSKGLEFKHVFLTSCDDTCWGRSKGNNNMLALPKNLAQIRHTGATDDERLRVLFVAVTRAKENLIMTNSAKSASGKPLARLAFLNESSREEAIQNSPFIESVINLHNEDVSVSDKITSLKLGWAARYTTYTSELSELLKSRVANYKLSASDLTSFLNIIYAGPQELYKRLVLRAPDSPSTYDQRYGTLIHKVYEEITNHGITDEDALALFQSMVPATELEPDDQRRLSEMGAHNLPISLKAFGDILRHPHAKGEINLSPEHPVLNHNDLTIPLVGKIDHIEINPETKTAEVYDYKTGKYRDKAWDSHPSTFMYRLQLGFYKLLLNLSPSYQNYTVTRGHILFVTPDEDDQVYDKVYTYNDKDETELKDLIAAVYHQITSLNYVHKPDLFLASDKGRTMKQVREFIAKLLTPEE